MKNTINYYNKNAQEFHDRTINTDLSEQYQSFLMHLPKKSLILDAGCGVGRDSKHFLNQGYEVTAFDASEIMVSLASEITGLKVHKCTFQEMEFDNQFEGVWAQASLLHVPYNETKMIYEKIYRALKPQGIFYASYKYGHDHMSTPERDFWLMDESLILPYFEGLFDVIDLWTEKDTRSKISPSKEQMWLNFIVKKK